MIKSAKINLDYAKLIDVCGGTKGAALFLTSLVEEVHLQRLESSSNEIKHTAALDRVKSGNYTVEDLETLIEHKKNQSTEDTIVLSNPNMIKVLNATLVRDSFPTPKLPCREELDIVAKAKEGTFSTEKAKYPITGKVMPQEEIIELLASARKVSNKRETPPFPF